MAKKARKKTEKLVKFPVLNKYRYF